MQALPSQIADPSSSNLCNPSDPLMKLSCGETLPRVGFGTHQLADGCQAAVSAALDAGYLLIDTASIYKNEEAVGVAVNLWETEHQAHGSIRLASKCSTYEMGFDKARLAFEASLQRLGRDSLDVYLIHWPGVAKKKHESSEHRTARHETWKALETLYREGRVRLIGVSNFNAVHLQQLIDDGVEIMPMLNQVEAHPLFVPEETVTFCSAHGIVIQAYSPLGGGPHSNAARAEGEAANGTLLLLQHAVVREVSEETGRTPAQVLLRWGLQRGFAVVPRSRNPVRIVENLDVFGFSLDQKHMALLNSLQTETVARKFCWDSSSVK